MKSILIFNDISGLGNCSMTANIAIFSRLGHYCMPVVTATYSCQTGFQNFTCQRNEKLPKCVAEITAHRMPSAVYVGFCAGTDLLCEVTAEVDKLPAEILKFVDPILGDNGALYSVFDKGYVAAMKKLVKGAYCITPNITEACLLTGISYAELISHQGEPTFLAHCGKVFANICETLDVHNAVITGVQCGSLLGNIVLQKGSACQYVTNQRVPVNYSGTGDAFSSVLLGELLCGATLLSATQIAANFVGKSAELTQCTDSRFGVEFSRALNLL